jgi:hypothetical protein
MAGWGFEILRSAEVADTSLVLRRYVDHCKFESLLQTQSLYFSPASHFSDEVEGYYTHRDYEHWERELVRSGFDELALSHARQAKVSLARWNRRAVLVSCWTNGRFEDARMWREYAQGSEAVAIETTVGHLRRILGPYFLIVPVTYLDYTEWSIPKTHSLQPYFCKQDRYAWEREVRIIGEMEVGKRIETPRLVRVDLPVLLRRVIISPYASSDYAEAVALMLREASIGAEVNPSSLRNAA